MGRTGGAWATALAAHVLTMLLLSRLRAPSPRASPSLTAIELELSVASSPPSTPAPLPPQRAHRPHREAVERRVASMQSSAIDRARGASPPTTEPPPPAASSEPSATAPPATAPSSEPHANAPPSTAPSSEPPGSAPSSGPAGTVELFPHGVLQALARPTTLGPPPGERADREGPSSWLDDASAEARTRAGGVAPVWRQIERELTQTFKPPVDVVHEVPSKKSARVADRLKSFLKQSFAVMTDPSRTQHPVEPGSTLVDVPPGRSIDPSQQSFLGMPEGMNLRAMPLEQQQAAMAATALPASWLRVEIEIVVDEAGRIARARVALPSGRRAFDRFALAAVQAQVERSAGAAPSTVSRWVCEAGYAVARPDSIGVNFDLSMLFDKQLRKQFSVEHPLKERVDSHVSLKWVKPAH